MKTDPSDQAEDSERPARPRPEPPPVSTSYGGQIVLADLGAFVAGYAVAAATGRPEPLVLLWLLTSPVVHSVHGHPGTGVGSFFLHLGMPILGAFAGALAYHPCNGDPGEFGEGCTGWLIGAGVGTLVGMAAATTIDATSLAQFPDERHRHVADAGGGASAPLVAIGRNGDVTVGWRGMF